METSREAKRVHHAFIAVFRDLFKLHAVRDTKQRAAEQCISRPIPPNTLCHHSTSTRHGCGILLFIATLLSAPTGSAIAQSTVSPILTSPNVQASANATARQLEWLQSTLEQRVVLAESIGEAGARDYARSKGWIALVDGRHSSLRQGFDQVYRSVDDVVIVVEAKGGNSSLGHAYGYAQGTSEWAVKASERTIRSTRASDAEKGAAEAVLKAAREGCLETAVIRTTHTLGEPSAPRLQSQSMSGDDAAKLAIQALDDLTEQGLLTLDDALRGAAAITVARAAAKAAIPVSIGLDTGLRIHDAVKVEEAFFAGEITQLQRERTHAENLAGLAGGWGGALAGAELGAMGGGAVGTLIAPGPGTVIGGVIGGAAGGIGGYYGGEAVAETAVDWAVSRVHETGATLGDIVSDTCDAAGDAASLTRETASHAWRWTSDTADSALVWLFGD